MTLKTSRQIIITYYLARSLYTFLYSQNQSFPIKPKEFSVVPDYIKNIFGNFNISPIFVILRMLRDN